MDSVNIGIEECSGWYHPSCSPLVAHNKTIQNEQQMSKHRRCPSIDSDLILQRIAASQPGKCFGTQIEHHQEDQIQYSYIQVETSSPLANITPESLPMLEALCRQPQLLKRLAEGVLTEVNSNGVGQQRGGNMQMNIPTGLSTPTILPSLPNYAVEPSFVSPGMTVGFKAPVFDTLVRSETGSCRTDSPAMSSDMDTAYAEVDRDNQKLRDCVYESREGFMDPRPNKNYTEKNGYIVGGVRQEEQVNCPSPVSSQVSNKSGKVRRVKSNGPQENANRRGLPRGIVKRLSWWLCQHAKNPYPTKAEKQELAAALGIDKNQVSNWFVNARTRFWKPIVVKIFQQHYNRLFDLAQATKDEANLKNLNNVNSCFANVNAPNLIALFDKQAIEHLEQDILEAFEAGFNEI